ncbi:MAG TPA: AzlD domain-containing protein [Opitutaceae bacterium]
MKALDVWLAILAGGVLTFAIRLSFIGLLSRVALPVWFARWLRLVPAAALAALIAPEVVGSTGEAGTPGAAVKGFAALAAALIAWRTRNVAWSVLAGMAVFLAGRELT